MKSKTSTEYSYVTRIKTDYLSNHRHVGDPDGYENRAHIPALYEDDIVGGYLFFDGEYYGPIRAVDLGISTYYIITADELPEKMEYQTIKVYKKQSVTTTTYPPFYHKAKKGQSLYVKKNGAIGKEPDAYVKTGGKIKKLY